MTVVVDIVGLIKNSMHLLRDSEQLVAKVVLANQKFVINATTTELAKRADVSTTSITRFCRALGFKGLREFKLCVAQNLAVSSHFMDNAVEQNDSFPKLVQSLTKSLSDILKDINSELPISSFSKALNILASCKHISLFAVDQLSQGVAIDAQIRLLRLSLETSVHISGEDQRMIISASHRDSVLILISSDGCSLELGELLELITLHDIKAIIIAPQTARSYSKNTVFLPIHTIGVVDIFAQPSVRYKQLIIIDLLCLGYSHNLSEHTTDPPRKIGKQVPPPLKH
jgi:RpiR family transcriptional regulator, carbohydrate utilization regulator